MSPRTLKILRLAALAVLVGGLFVLGTQSGIEAFFDLDHLRRMTSEAGLAGMVGFVGICTAGYLMQLPGLIFVLAALLGWGTITGGIMAFIGLTVATSVSFWTVRLVGGSPISDIEHDYVQKVLGQLDDHPVRTVVILRVLFLVKPVVNLSLVLTDVRFRDYFLGTIIGFILPLGFITVATDTVMAYVEVG